MPHGKVAIVFRGLFKPLRGRQGPGVTEYTILLAALVFGSTTAIGTVGGSFSAMCQNTSGIVAAPNGSGNPHLPVRRSTKLALRDKTVTESDVKPIVRSPAVERVLGRRIIGRWTNEALTGAQRSLALSAGRTAQ